MQLGVTDVNNLIAELERATEGSRELDEIIHHSIIPSYTPQPNCPSQQQLSPHYTTSLDAALTLVPEGWFIWGLSDHRTSVHYLGDKHEHVCWRASLQTLNGGRLTVASGKALSLALCIASLSARQAMKEDG